MSGPAQTSTDELRQWVRSQIGAGTAAHDLLTAMTASGWDEAVARATLDEFAGLAPGPAFWPAAAARVPEPELAEGQWRVEPEGHAVQLLLSMRHPRLMVLGGLLTDDECEALIAAARDRMQRSLTVELADGGSEVNAARTSRGMFFSRGETDLVARIEQRIATLVRWPVSWGEGLQVLHYPVGAEYRPHHDYFDPRQPGSAALTARGGQRVATLVMYLNTPQRGGATIFPDVMLEVAARRGDAVFFSYDRAHPATRTLHGGAPVLAGEKWVATKWLREREFV